MNCGYGEKLILYLYGESGEGQRAEVEKHLGSCAACRGELSALRAAGAGLAARAAEPSGFAVAAIMRAARAAAAGRRGFVFKWSEAVLSGALASALAVVFAFSGRTASADLAWNSSLDSGLESAEYSVYQASSDMTASGGDWDYEYSALEGEALSAGESV